MKIIRLVTSVERTPVSNLQGMQFISEDTVKLPQGISWEPIATKPFPKLGIEEKRDGTTVIWSAKLVLLTPELTHTSKRWAYRCRLKDGRYRLIGTDERPFPVTSGQDSMPDKVTENQLYEVTVEWQSPRSVPFIEG